MQRCMVMDWHGAALGMAGVVGSGVAVVHGVLTQRLRVRPFEQVATGRIAAPTRRLVPLLLQSGPFTWSLAGLALIAAASWFGKEASFATGRLAAAPTYSAPSVTSG